MIEVSVSIFMILVCLFCYENTKRRLLITNEKRIEKHNKEVSIDALSKEIKYNVSYSWVEKKLSNKEWIIKYDENFINEIEKIDIDKLRTINVEDGDKIHVNAKTIGENYIEIEIKLLSDNEEINKDIIKYPWMDYV